MVMPSCHFCFRIDLADLGGESLTITAPRKANLSHLVDAIRPVLGRLCGTQLLTGSIGLALADDDLDLGDVRELDDILSNTTERILRLSMLDPDPSIVAHAASRKKETIACWREAVKRLGTEFAIDASVIQAQLSTRNPLQENVAAPIPDTRCNDTHAACFFLVSSLSGETKRIHFREDTSLLSLQTLLDNVEAMFGVPSGGADLIWNSRRFLRGELGSSVQDVGLCSGDELAFVRTSDSRLLAFLACLQIDHAHVTSSGHGLGGSTNCRIEFHLADLMFDFWAVEEILDGYQSLSAQLVQRAREVTICLMQLQLDEDGNKYEIFQAPSDVWDSLSERIGLLSSEIQRALSCVSLSDKMQQAILGRGTSYIESAPATKQELLWQPEELLNENERFCSRHVTFSLPHAKHGHLT